MRTRVVLHALSLSGCTLLLAACGGGSAASAKTEVLPADGADVGKAFTELVAALAAGDKVKSGSLLDPDHWHMDNKSPDFLKQIADQSKDFVVTGGKRHGDVATVFLVNKQPYYASLTATHTAGGWRFDSPIPTGRGFGEQPRDCAEAPQRFPCAAASAPDAQVGGTVLSHRKGDPITGSPKTEVYFDGVAVRMIDGETKKPKGTRVVLAAKGIDPQALARLGDPDDLVMFVNYPVLEIKAAPDGKSGTLMYFDGLSRHTLELHDGFALDSATPNRVRGKLTFDAKDVADFDVAFDLGSASECVDGGYECR